MMQAPPTFGKRRSPTDVDPPRSGVVSATLPDATSAFLAKERQIRAPEVRRPARVPNSIRAGLLAGLVVSFMNVGLGIELSTEFGQQFAALAVDGQPVPILPLILLGSLWSGARATASALFIVHWLMKRLGRTGHVGYAACCAGVAVLYAAAVQALGLGVPDHGWPFEIIAGAAAGFLYRLFAGALRD